MKHALSSAGRYFILLLVFLLALAGWTTASRIVTADFSVSTESKLIATDAAAGDHFGYAVSISGDTAVVGAYYKGTGTGAAYVFVRSGSTWSQQSKLTAPDAANNDYFGCSVSISGDTIAVGAYNKNSGKGAVYVFTRSGTAWSQQQELFSTSSSDAEWFGYAVSVSGDTLVAGAPYRDFVTGAAYIYTRTAGVWSYQTNLVVTPSTDVTSSFGSSVSLNGGTALIGSPGTGAAYVFSGSGSVWSQQAKLNGSDAGAADLFGCSVSVNADAAVVGADQWSAYTGAAYVFVRSGTSWSQQQKLTAGDNTAGDYFGSSVSISADTVIVGANSRNNYQGAAYVFVRSGTVWSQQSELLATDASNGAQFGDSVSIDGAQAVVGAQWKNTGTGAAYVYNDSLTPPTTITTPPPTTTTTPPTTTTTSPTTTTTPPTTTTAPPTTTTSPPTTTTTPPTTTTTTPPPPPPPPTTPATTTPPPPTTTTTTTTTTTMTTTTSSTTITSTVTTTTSSGTTTTTIATTSTDPTTASPVATTAPPANTSLPGATTGTQASDTTSTEVQTTGTSTSNVTTPAIQPTVVDDQTPLYVWIPLVIAAVILIGAGAFVIRRR